MKEHILYKKIKTELNNLPINTESRAMYFLVEIRKVLEYEKQNNLLRFYCDWVVHIKLDRAFSQKVFDRLVDEDSIEGSHIKNFNKLRNELELFLKKHDLTTELTKNHWAPFRDRLIDILVDTPIQKVEDKIIGSFIFQKRSSSGIEYCICDGKGIKELGKIEI